MKILQIQNLGNLFWQFTVPRGISYPYLVCPRHLSSDLIGVTFNLIKMPQSLFIEHPHFLHYHLQYINLYWTCFFVFFHIFLLLITHHVQIKETSLHNGWEQVFLTRFQSDIKLFKNIFRSLIEPETVSLSFIR